VAVGEVGEEEIVPAAGVEGLDVRRPGLLPVDPLEVGQRGPERVPDGGRQGGDRSAYERQPLPQCLVGVAEQQRGGLPGPGQLLDVETLRSAASRQQAHRAPSSPSPGTGGGGNSPCGLPLPSQLSRLTRSPLSSGAAIVSAVWRSWSIAKFSAAIGATR